MPAAEDQLQQKALAYLAGHQVVTLATEGPLGLWAAAVFYVNDGFDLFFLSSARTRHSRNIAARPRVAATIQEDYADWPSIQGIQMEGEAAALTGAARLAATHLYRQKYPFLAQPAPPIQAALDKVTWYCLRPSLLYFIDNSQGFGHRDVVPLPE